MKLLILTQKVDRNDPILGFFHRWIEEFAKHCEQIIVICLEKGEYNLPANVKVLSLGKEEYSRHSHVIRRLVSLYRFYKYIWNERKNYDAVFVHMNQEYVLLGGIVWRLLGKKIGLWYVHRQVSWRLHLAVRLVQIIFTSSPESFGIRSKKIKYLGHGVDVDICKPRIKNISRVIICIGRLTKIKNCETLIEALNLLPELRAEFIGGVITTEDMNYEKGLRELARTRGLEHRVIFTGFVPQSAVKDKLLSVQASVNLTPTGGMDKAVLESLAASCPIFTSNIAFRKVLAPYSDYFIFEYKNPFSLAHKISSYFFLTSQKREEISLALNEKVQREYSLDNLILQIYQFLK